MKSEGERGNRIIAQRVKRKLSAILSADVDGYSRLMTEDEEATAEMLKNYGEVMASPIR